MTVTASRWLSLALLAMLAGCRLVQYEDPNVARPGTLVDAKVLRRNLVDVHTDLERRVAKGEITRPQKNELIKKYCDKILVDVKLETVPKSQAWEYADVVRQADRWDQAYALLKVAVASAKSEDRRVNDSLKLAWCAAHLGKTDEAFTLARSTFSTPPEGKAPILFGILYEISPDLEGKGRDAEVAQLIEDAIEQHEQVKVDPTSESGKVFLASRAHHLRRGWDEVLKLFVKAGRTDLAKKALEKADQSTDQSARI
jgi:tetratricopeptide (TPR) repeat protein